MQTPNFKKDLREYISELDDALCYAQPEVEKVITFLRYIRDRNGTLWILGNGGSLALAQHFAQDLVKLRNMRAQAIACPSIITAYTNDESFEKSLYSPLSVLRSEGDGIFIFSCSGNSRNYRAIADAKWPPLISVVGCDGGFLKQASDACVHVLNNNYQVCETAFSVVADLINFGMEE